VGRLLGRTHPRIIHPSTHKQNAHPTGKMDKHFPGNDLYEKLIAAKQGDREPLEEVGQANRTARQPLVGPGPVGEVDRLAAVGDLGGFPHDLDDRVPVFLADRHEHPRHHAEPIGACLDAWNQGCWSEVWLMTNSVMTLIPQGDCVVQTTVMRRLRAI